MNPFLECLEMVYQEETRKETLVTLQSASFFNKKP